MEDIEKHIKNLKQYIKEDEIIENDNSDFAQFCKGHIEDIQAVLNELNNSISKDELQKIVNECIPKKENIITGELEYSTNANANSFLAQEILNLLNKE